MHEESIAASTRALVTEEVRARLAPGGRAWLIGSLAWGGFGVRSDVDLVLNGVPAEVAVELERAVARAAKAPVDLLILETLPAAFRARVEREGLTLHGP